MSSEDRAWAAGLFEGEGTITHSAGRPRLQLKMTDPEPVRRFCAVVGVGKVYGPYRNRAGETDGYPRSDFMLWVGTEEAGRAAFELMRPWLSSYALGRFAKIYTGSST